MTPESSQPSSRIRLRREGFEGSQDYDLALRIAERTAPERIHHIPWVLYHWRQQGETASFSESFLAKCADSAGNWTTFKK